MVKHILFWIFIIIFITTTIIIVIGFTAAVAVTSRSWWGKGSGFVVVVVVGCHLANLLSQEKVITGRVCNSRVFSIDVITD